VRLQELGDCDRAGARGAAKLLEEGGHGARVVLRAGKNADADIVGFPLVGACEVDLLLHHRGLPAERSRGSRAAGSCSAERDGSQQKTGHWQGHLVRSLDHAGKVALPDMRDLVSQDRGQFALCLCLEYEAAMDADIAIGTSEGVDAGVLDGKKGEISSAGITVPCELVPDRLQVGADERIIDDITVRAHVAHEGASELGFEAGAQMAPRGVAHVGQGQVDGQSRLECPCIEQQGTQESVELSRHLVRSVSAGGVHSLH